MKDYIHSMGLYCSPAAFPELLTQDCLLLHRLLRLGACMDDILSIYEPRALVTMSKIKTKLCIPTDNNPVHTALSSAIFTRLKCLPLPDRLRSYNNLVIHRWPVPWLSPTNRKKLMQPIQCGCWGLFRQMLLKLVLISPLDWLAYECNLSIIYPT